MLFLVEKKNYYKYNEIWSEIKKSHEKKKVDSNPVFNNTYLRTKIKSDNKKITTNFKNIKNNCIKSYQKRSKCICLAAIIIDSVLKIKKKEMKSFIKDDLESYFDDD